MTVERSAERDAGIDAMLPFVPTLGWSRAALRRGLTEAGGEPADAALLYPAGPVDMVAVYADLADRRMAAAAAAAGVADLRLSQRVRAVIATRLAQSRPHREAVRRGLAVLAWRGRPAVAAAITGRTVDAIWYAAGDRSVDFSWYTKRAILAGVYGATLLRWLDDRSEGDADTLAFLDRRLANLAQLGRSRRKAS